MVTPGQRRQQTGSEWAGIPERVGAGSVKVGRRAATQRPAVASQRSVVAGRPPPALGMGGGMDGRWRGVERAGRR